MKQWLKHHGESAWLVGLTLAAVLLLALYAMTSLFLLGRQYSEEAERMTPRIARMAGMVAAESQLGEAVASARARLQQLAYPVEQDQAAVSAALQKNLRELIADAGMTIANSRLLPLRQSDHFEYITLNVNASGSLASLDEVLAQLAVYEPLVVIEGLDVKPQRVTNRPDQDVALVVNLSLMSLRNKL